MMFKGSAVREKGRKAGSLKSRSLNQSDIIDDCIIHVYFQANLLCAGFPATNKNLLLQLKQEFYSIRMGNDDIPK